MVDETRKWLEDKLSEQEKQPLTEEPVFLAAELSRKVSVRENDETRRAK